MSEKLSQSLTYLIKVPQATSKYHGQGGSIKEAVEQPEVARLY